MSVFGQSNESDKFYEEIFSTKIDKMLRILNETRDFLIENDAPEEKADNLNWVITNLVSNDLYDYEAFDISLIKDSPVIKKDENAEIFLKSFSQFISSYANNSPTERNPNRKKTEITLKNRVKLTTKMKRTDFKKSSSKQMKNRMSLFRPDTEEPEIIPVEEPLKQAEKKENPYFEPSFNIHKYETQVGRADVLPTIGEYLIDFFELSPLIDASKLKPLLCAVRDGYKQSVKYHNELHGVDVCCTSLNMIYEGNIISKLELNDFDLLAVWYSMLVHDISHPGFNNGFLINETHELALVYNDKSVLENFHCSTGIKLLSQDELNVFAPIEKSDFKHIKRRIIELILSTDMAFHAKWVTFAKNCVFENKISESFHPDCYVASDCKDVFEFQQNLLNFVVHSADISHNCKLFEVSFKWTYLLMEEFWEQGDTEKKLGLPISFLCDRIGANVPHGQIGFIKGLILPNFSQLSLLFPELKHYEKQAIQNGERWQSLDDDLQKSGYQ